MRDKTSIILYIIGLLTGIGLLILHDPIAEKMQQQYELGYVKGFNSCVLSILDSKNKDVRNPNNKNRLSGVRDI